MVTVHVFNGQMSSPLMVFSWSSLKLTFVNIFGKWTFYCGARTIRLHKMSIEF